MHRSGYLMLLTKLYLCKYKIILIIWLIIFLALNQSVIIVKYEFQLNSKKQVTFF